MDCENCPYDDPIERENRYKRLYSPKDPDWQPEYLWCDKVGGEHWQYGYCSDLDYNKKDEYYDCKKQDNKNNSKRESIDKNKRQYVSKQKDQRLRQIIRQGGYAPHRGYLDWGLVDGEWQEIGNHIKYPKNSNTQRWIKKITSRKIRRSKNVPQHNGYRRYVDYWYIMY